MKKTSIIVGLALLLGGCSLATSRQPAPANQQPSTNQEQPGIGQNQTGSNPPAQVGARLDLSGQGLTKIPDYVFNRTDLEELNVSNNRITGAIQAEIRKLSKLKILNLSDNLMTGVPAEIGQLSRLEVLDLSNNQLTGLPNELGNLKNLKTLNLSGNAYSQQDLDVIMKGLPKTVNVIK